MIPILYEKTETAFVNNGLGRLRDCISCVVTEERNGIYECDFEYPMNGAHFDEIKVGRIIAVTHDDTGDVQPFDIVSYTRPIDGVVAFHCTHISYRLSFYTVRENVCYSLGMAQTFIQERSIPRIPFRFGITAGWDPSGICAIFDGVPHSVRSVLGGTEGSVLDAYGGEYEWNRWDFILHRQRGEFRNFTIRYGVNMLNYEEEYTIEEAYSAVIPYWTDGTSKVIGNRQTGTLSTITGRGETVPLDVSDKFETKPTRAQVNAEGLRQLNASRSALPVQNIKVEFARLQDLGLSELANLMTCRLCDTIRVIFPDANAGGNFKIVKITWNVLTDKYDSMELGELSTTLSDALGISSGGGNISGGGSYISIISDDSSTVTTKTVASNASTWTTMSSVSLGAGTYLLIGYLYWAGNSNGTRDIRIDTSLSGASGANRFNTLIANGQGNQRIQLSTIITLTSPATVYLGARQNSGASLSCSGVLNYIGLIS